MIGSYAVLAEKISSLSFLSRLHKESHVDFLQFPRQYLWFFEIAQVKKLPPPFL